MLVKAIGRLVDRYSARVESVEGQISGYFYAFLVLFTTLLYTNSLHGDFAYDDRLVSMRVCQTDQIVVCSFSRAIVSNQDVLPNTPWYSLFTNDYWGTPIFSSNSHGSYRPIATISFRFNCLAHGLSPYGFHLANLVLHVCVTLLFVRLLSKWFKCGTRITIMSSMLFACHPIHVESVTSIVGRADLGAALFYILCIIHYIKFVRDKHAIGNLYISLAMATLSMLTKEHGVTCLMVCGVYHVFIVHKLFPFSMKSYKQLFQKVTLAQNIQLNF